MTTSSLFGCAPSHDAQSTAWQPPEPPPSEITIAFDPADSLALGLREEHVLSVVVDPPHHQEVNFVLLGSSLDATLDHAAVKTNDEGRASVVLRAPNQATDFRVRSWIMRGPADEISVAAIGDGFAPVEIIPIYKGIRPISEWTASIVPRATCADISPLLPAEVAGAISGHSSATEPLIVQDAPVGPNLAVTVRAGEFAWGCTDAHDLVVGETTTVKVNVIDKPIEIGETNLEVTFDLKPDPKAYGLLLEATSSLLANPLSPSAIEPGAALLDAIAAQLPPSMATGFDVARTTGGWDLLTTTHLALQPQSIHQAIEGWVLTGLSSEPFEFVATLKALPEKGKAILSPLRFGSVPALDVGMPVDHLVSLQLDSGDVMHLGGTLYWLPSQYVGAVIQQQALMDAAEGTTMADVLSMLAACDVLGQTLGGFETCDASCVAGLCHEALANQWERAIDASAYSGGIGTINISAAVTTSVDETAVPTSFQGSWRGDISDGNLVAKISKAELSAELPAADPTP